MPMLEARDLTLAVDGRTLCAGLNLAFRDGENWAILGANGSGKTTLLHTLAGLRRPARGSVHLDGQDISRMPSRQRARRLGVLLQDYETGFPASVLDTVLSGRHPHLQPMQRESAADYNAAHEALVSVGLAALAARSLATLSGGERRRVEIAALLAQDPPILLLDEPTNHLDLRHQGEMLRLLAERARRPGHLNLFVLHDVNAAAHYCTHSLLLFDDGDHIAGPLREILARPNLERLYRCALRELGDGADRYFLPT